MAPLSGHRIPISRVLMESTIFRRNEPCHLSNPEQKENDWSFSVPPAQRVVNARFKT